MLKTYRAVFELPGTVAFSAASFLMRFSISVYPIGLVLLVSTRTGHYAFAGVLSGIYVFANGVGNPVLARLVDRHGQSRVLLPASAVHLAGVVAIIVLVRAHAPDWTLIPPTVVFGFSYLAVGSLVRARWSFVLAGRPELGTAYSLESTLDELIFTVGPLLATVIATQLDPVLVFVVGGVLVAAGTVWLRMQRGTEPPAQAAGAPRHVSALRYKGMVLLTLAAAGMGAVFASAEVTMIAFCGQHGSTGSAGLVLACFAFGSGVAGFVYGSRHRTGDVLRRFRRQALIFAVLPLLFLAAVNIPVVALLAFVVGLGIAPMLITSFGLIEGVVPAAALTEGMAWLTTGLSIGYGLAAAIVGRLADVHGARSAFSVTIAAGLLVGAMALVLFQRLSDRASASQPVAVA
ncbi:MAG: putative arabinose efflux permease, family [Pseudonocardiales bacterium]|nr:putative arabinose efflux permease, family [Pseudonocardiales bacterium]